MERTHRLHRPAKRRAERGVSILVVMERTHRPRSTGAPAAHRLSFNPCCDGTDSSTVRLGGGCVRRAGVSILVVMERTHRRRANHAERPPEMVSILVVMERTHRRPRPRPNARAQTVEFQSLL